MQRGILIVVVVIALAVIAWALWPAGGFGPEPAPEPVEEAPPAPPITPPEPVTTTPRETPATTEPEPEPEEPLPPLPESDAYVRERLEPLDLPERWLEQGDYVRRLAVLTENAARGELPRRQLAFLAPRGPFKVVERDDRTFVDPESYGRYDRYVAELESVDPGQLAGLLGTIEPLMESALGEIGVQAPPGEVLESAVEQVLAVPVLEGEVELVQPNVMYEYANPELESLSPLQKQVLRMGPGNVQRLQDYLRRLARELELSVDG